MPSFDTVSKIQWNEVDNTLQQAQKEIAQRFDFKNTETSLEKKEELIVLSSATEERCRAVFQVLQEKLTKRKVSLKFLYPQKPEPAGKCGTRMSIKIKERIDGKKGKTLVHTIKESRREVQAYIQKSQVCVTGKNKDDLQTII
ncbi:DUF520 family protein [Pajaroellobacter abortibovis]|uniref:Nucleotide-binding protein BCY86_05780 n=1 Tax=Pajaroellobacter abortibovis TaxID=1882918 RepID=A0A1L6MXM4_9BACT|nr:DUF520 family protein [Pajaroellobacter abortibovis]APS00247.1 hypothetical protein BCY86_05780 [Pajaroellobacter abortibovis]